MTPLISSKDHNQKVDPPVSVVFLICKDQLRRRYLPKQMLIEEKSLNTDNQLLYQY